MLNFTVPHCDDTQLFTQNLIDAEMFNNIYLVITYPATCVIADLRYEYYQFGSKSLHA